MLTTLQERAIQFDHLPPTDLPSDDDIALSEELSESATLADDDSSDSAGDDLQALTLEDSANGISIEDLFALEGYRPMIVALVQTAPGLKAPSGGFRGNYATIQTLTLYGHKTLQFVWANSREVTTAITESKLAGTFIEAEWDFGFTNMPGPNGGTQKTEWWRFVNVHGILCVALESKAMSAGYNAHCQQLDAQEWVEVSI